MTTAAMTAKMREGRGFIAALDQSGGSTPKALRQYGIDEGAWSDEAGMFDIGRHVQAQALQHGTVHRFSNHRNAMKRDWASPALRDSPKTPQATPGGMIFAPM